MEFFPDIHAHLFVILKSKNSFKQLFCEILKEKATLSLSLIGKRVIQIIHLPYNFHIVSNMSLFSYNGTSK